jgi:nucleoside-diphosphate-sugar epimerase
MHALVTGAGGFLGRYIVEALVARGDRVRGLARGAYPELTAIGVELVRGDLADKQTVVEACRDVDCVFHVASRVGIWGPRHDYYLANVVGTENVIDACRRQGVGRLVFTSSPSVTFDGRDQVGVDESAPYPREWLAHYPHSKALAEQAVLAANGDTLATCALRPHLVWGPRDHHLTSRLVERARTVRLRRVGEGANLVDMIYVENAAEAHLLAADALAMGTDSPRAEARSPAGKAYFLSQGEPVNCWGWIDEILALVDLPPVRQTMSLAAARRVGLACEAIWTVGRLRGEPPMTRFLASQLATSHWFDISAARRDFGYQPRISTEEGMRRLGEWLRTR